ncbi:HAMP domain-containing histidine kinase [Aerococcaceae bacterium DSM 111021]|nr:HAMP domain-containing histidine kinase [Aerococcaceae bacterium DSM 111021]
MKKWLESRLWIYFSFVTLLLTIIFAATLIIIVLTLEQFSLLPDFDSSPKLSWVIPITFSSVIGVVISGIVMIQLLNPIIKLKKAMSKVIESDFSVQLDENQRIAEVSELYHSFNLMVNELNSIQRLQSDFTSVISHEFKTPLSSIQGYAQLLQSPDLSQSERETYQHRIIVATKQLSGLSENILKLSKLDNQSISIERKSYRLDEQIRESILSLYNQWDEKNLTMTIDLDSTVLYANEDLLNQVWINLLDNAIKYSEQNGQIIIHLKDSKDYVEIIIEDTGIGIPSEKLDIIFERFFQVDGSRFTSGNGLGLAIVKRIIENHEGTIEYQSELGDGTKVIIMLPHKKVVHTK